MLILRKYSKNNKIKNRYIITMGYKSKKINRRRNYKRQSRKSIYGGKVGLQSNNDSLIQEEKNDTAANKIMYKIEEQNKIEFPKIEEIPVVGPVLDKTVELVNGTAVKGLDIIGDAIGVDIDNPQSISEKLDDIKDVISNPEKVEKTKEILNNAGKYVEVGIEAVTPVIEKTVDKVFPVVAKEADKAVKAGLGTAINLAEDVAGPFIGIPRTLLSAAEAVNASINAGSELIKGTAEIIQGTKENYTRLIDEKMSDFLKKSDMYKIKEFPKNSDMNKIKEFPKNSEMPKFEPTANTAEDSLKNYQKEAKMIGGRTHKSQLDFLSSYVNSSQIIHQYGGKWSTKSRRSLKGKFTSRRR